MWLIVQIKMLLEIVSVNLGIMYMMTQHDLLELIISSFVLVSLQCWKNVNLDHVYERTGLWIFLSAKTVVSFHIWIYPASTMISVWHIVSINGCPIKLQNLCTMYMLIFHINKLHISKYLNNIYLFNYNNLDLKKMLLVYRQQNTNSSEWKPQ